MYLLCVFRPRTLRREIKLLCMTIMCTWNSSLASVLKKGENRCHRKISARFCFLSRWVGVLKYLFWLWSGRTQVSRQASSPGIDEPEWEYREGLQRATRWSWLCGWTRSWGYLLSEGGVSVLEHLHPSASFCPWAFAASEMKQQIPILHKTVASSRRAGRAQCVVRVLFMLTHC